MRMLPLALAVVRVLVAVKRETSSTSSFVYANDKISSGGQHTCAILDNGDLKCWGFNMYGQLGIPFNSAVLAPTVTICNLHP